MATSTRSAPGRSARRRPSPTKDAPLGAPLFLLNLKAYPTCLGAGAERMGRLLQRLSAEYGVNAAVAPAAPDLGRLARVLRIPVLAQHADPAEPGARTGHIVVDSIRAAGGRGSLVNHSERPLSSEEVGTIVARLRSVGLIPVVCASDVETARRLAAFHPPYLAVEPPELIGGERSVSTARPEVVEGTVRAVRSVAPETHVLCGAGIHDRRDVQLALRLGSEGVLVASAVTGASDPARALRELLEGFRPQSPSASSGPSKSGGVPKAAPAFR